MLLNFLKLQRVILFLRHWKKIPFSLAQVTLVAGILLSGCELLRATASNGSKSALPACESAGKAGTKNPHCQPVPASSSSPGPELSEFSGIAVADAVADNLDQIIVGGFAYNSSLTEGVRIGRFNRDGTVDKTFGIEGVFSGEIGSPAYSYSRITAVAIQKDGKIVAAGSTRNETSYDVQYGNNYDVLLIRLNPDGTPDRAFGENGTTRLSLLSTNPGESRSHANYAGVAIQSDGKIVVVANNSRTAGHDVDIIRYNSDGSIDSGFGTNGITTTKFGDTGGGYTPLPGHSNIWARSIAINDIGKIIVAGGSFVGGDTQDPGASDHFTLLQYTQNGNLDNSFGTNGMVRLSLSAGANSSDFHSMTVQRDGRIVAGGRLSREGYLAYALLRFRADGTLDNTFGTSGMLETVTPGGGGYVRSLKALDDGGFMSLITVESGKAVTKHLSSGAVDSRFGTNGSAVLDTAYFSSRLAVTSKGEVFVVKSFVSSSPRNSIVRLVRVAP